MAKRAIVLAVVAAALSPAVAHARFGDADTSYGRGGVAPIKVPIFGFPAPGPTRPLAVRVNAGNTIDVVAPTGDGARFVLSQLRYDATLTRISQVRAPFGVSGFAPFRTVQTSSGFATLGATVTALGTQATVVRTTASGALDTTFGRGGVVRLPAGQVLVERSQIARGPSGTLVVAVYVQPAGATQPAVRMIRLRANGTFDTSFGAGGTVTIALRDLGHGAVPALVVMPDARVVVALGGYLPLTGANTVMRLRADGSRDTSFDSDGIAQSAPASVPIDVVDMVAQPDGKVTVLAHDYVPTTLPFMYRLGANGRVDGTFGDAASRTNLLASGITTGRSIDLIRRPDGRYAAMTAGTTGPASTIMLARTDANGKNGSTVALSGSDGLAPSALAATSTQTTVAAANALGRVALAQISDTNATGGAVAFSLDAAGGITQRSGPEGSQVYPDRNGRVLVASTFDAQTVEITSLTATGAMSQVFGPTVAPGGVRHVGLVQDGSVTRLRRLTDGRIAVTTAGGNGGSLIMLRSDGLRDTTFAGPSAGIFSFNNASYGFGDVVRLADGKLLIGYGRNVSGERQIGFLRLTADGFPDTSFSGDGTVELPYPTGLTVDAFPEGALHVHAGAGGYVAVAGASRTLIARVSTSGVPDGSLGGGTGVAAVGPPMRVVSAEVDNLGRTVVVGTTATKGIAVRLTSALALDTSFSGDGILTYTPPRGVAWIQSVAALPDRSLVMRATDFGGGFSSATTVYLMVSSRGVQIARSVAAGTALGGIPAPTADGRFVVGTVLPTTDDGRTELDLRRIKGILPAAPSRARRTIGRTFKVSVDARGLTRTTVLIQALRSGRWKTIGSKVVLARVGYRAVSLSTSRRVTDSRFRAVVINASGRTNGRAFAG